MKQVLVLPLHDPEAIVLRFLEKTAKEINNLYDRVYIGISPPTERYQNRKIQELTNRYNWTKVNNEPDTLIGDHWMNIIKTASESSDDSDIVHIGTPDRTSLALIKHRYKYKNDIIKEKRSIKPILYIRSTYAWQTHPKNYWQIESLATDLGKKLFGRRIDFFWCDLSLKNNLLKQIIPTVTGHGLTIETELLLPIIDKLVIKKVDWLEWEDPFIFDKDYQTYKTERENSLDENRKRLGYVIPTIELLLEKSIR